ncbi:hypothetical protein Cgig2_015358 [Carnegiea gigantea]|uniref:Uncharacterized protein n=1 Tax=Carnegiea gigantea TaxID=171969 RepID=A0A9Q1K6A0_9CARY|nr:hypothetical protein Cgig2_015358 [Carnegiea gigantea]
MVIFMGKTANGQCYLHIQPSENDVGGEETKLPIRNSIMSLCKSDCIAGPSSLPCVASFVTSGIGYCLPMAILMSVYKGLNEISYSSHPRRGGGYFLAHFLYAWLAKNFDAYELAGEASSSSVIVKFSGLGQAKSFRLEEARELNGFRRGFHWHSSIINRLKETLVDDGKLSRVNFTYFISIHSSFVSYHCEDNLIMEHYYPN